MTVEIKRIQWKAIKWEPEHSFLAAIQLQITVSFWSNANEAEETLLGSKVLIPDLQRLWKRWSRKKEFHFLKQSFPNSWSIFPPRQPGSGRLQESSNQHEKTKALGRAAAPELASLGLSTVCFHCSSHIWSMSALIKRQDRAKNMNLPEIQDPNKW